MLLCACCHNAIERLIDIFYAVIYSTYFNPVVNPQSVHIYIVTITKIRGSVLCFTTGLLMHARKKGISPTRVITALKMSKGSLSRWRSGGDTTNETKMKIADYLGISIDLLDKETHKRAGVLTI